MFKIPILTLVFFINKKKSFFFFGFTKREFFVSFLFSFFLCFFDLFLFSSLQFYTELLVT